MQNTKRRKGRRDDCFVFTSSLGTQWFYPVIDPYRTAGAGPYHYGYAFAWDGVEVTVTRNFSLTRCRMRVELSSSLTETKEIQAFNFFNDTWHDQIDSMPGGAVTAMTNHEKDAGRELRRGHRRTGAGSSDPIRPWALHLPIRRPMGLRAAAQ